MQLNFFKEDIEALPAIKTQAFQAWVSSFNKKQVKEINYIFSSDEYVLNVNRAYLNHDYYTDIITFLNSEVDEPIESDIFISVERVCDNAEKFSFGNFADEIHRVMAHGVLHLMGFDDKTEEDKIEMRAQEVLALEFINGYVSRETD
ncbi:MAG: rRNA maturation RNase YbeY [Saprospiraceae bacterium]|nr:rRNA maturation RNase YbeY [Saprospiraceae bacterium]